MKKHLSVIGLFCRSTSVPLAVVSIAAVCAEMYMFVTCMRENTDLVLEQCIRQSHVGLVLGAWYLLFCIILCNPGCNYGSKSSYTFRRLRIKERGVFFWQAGYNTVAFAMLLLMQIVTVYVMCRIYIAADPAGVVNHQTIFLAFYRSSLLHSILPLEETTKWFMNVIFLLSNGLCTAYFPFANRGGRFATVTLATTVITVVCFVCKLGYFSLVPLSLVLTAVIAILNVLGWEDEYEDHTENQTDTQQSQSSQTSVSPSV